jgi:hypothetical protein
MSFGSSVSAKMDFVPIVITPATLPLPASSSANCFNDSTIPNIRPASL